MSKMFEGRAEALLDIDERHELLDGGLSEFTGGGGTVTQIVEPKSTAPAPVIVPPLVPIEEMVASILAPALFSSTAGVFMDSRL